MANHLALKQRQDAAIFLLVASVCYFSYLSLPETWFKSSRGLGAYTWLILESDFSLGSISQAVEVHS